jgi:hypothetical protein
MRILFRLRVDVAGDAGVVERLIAPEAASSTWSIWSIIRGKSADGGAKYHRFGGSTTA